MERTDPVHSKYYIVMQKFHRDYTKFIGSPSKCFLKSSIVYTPGVSPGIAQHRPMPLCGRLLVILECSSAPSLLLMSFCFTYTFNYTYTPCVAGCNREVFIRSDSSLIVIHHFQQLFSIPTYLLQLAILGDHFNTTFDADNLA
jgi:hypothetical protein